MSRFAITLGERSSEDVAEILGVSKRTIERWVVNGIVDPYMADEWAWKIMGVHPLTVWGPVWLEGAEEEYEQTSLFDDALDVACLARLRSFSNSA